ncbi:type II toxin-antitoxin system RatA family toxin [Erwinia sp. V71]|uniref:type II toxin-antitoxin system RatA family toxin n=1 Tax=Erwinia sp. V71 TaxID=3369424 RepID=UPI003F63DE12
MTTFEKTMQVAFSQQQMYQLVADVAAYPEFLPWCRRVEILTDEDGGKRVRIELQQPHPVPLSITTHATFDPPAALNLQLVEGSFLSAFRGEWHFSPLTAGSCQVTFRVSYRFSNRLMKMALSPFFNMVVSMMPQLFLRRARRIYTPTSDVR